MKLMEVDAENTLSPIRRRSLVARLQVLDDILFTSYIAACQQRDHAVILLFLTR